MSEEWSADAGARGKPALLDRAGLAAAVLVPVTWGLTGVFVRLLDGTPAPLIVVLRLLVAVAALAPWLVRRRAALMTALRTPLTATMGAYYVLATEAFVRAPVADVTLIIGAAPVIALVLERARGRHPSLRQWLGAGLALGGLGLFLWPGASDHGGRTLGYLLAFGAACVSAAYAVGLRARASSAIAVDPIALTAGACLLGACVGLLWLLLDGSGVSVAPAVGLQYVVPLGVICTALPTLAYGIASARLPAVVTTSFNMLTPIFAALFAGLTLGEWPVFGALPGAVLVLAGLTLVLRPVGMRPPAAGTPP